jgi:hypothetical protein
MVLGPPKSRAGLRTVSLPSAILDEIAEHMRKYTGPGRDALVITGPKEAAIRRSNFNSWSTGGMQQQRSSSCSPAASRTGSGGRVIQHRLGGGVALPRPPPHRQHPCGVVGEQH